MNAPETTLAPAAPARLDWPRLGRAQRAEALQRPNQGAQRQRQQQVADIIAAVRHRGDAALREASQRFDGFCPDRLRVPTESLAAAAKAVPPRLQQAIAEAATRIEALHAANLSQGTAVETAPGVVCQRLPRAIRRVGLYVPAGSAPLPSTLLMLGIPARLAGCREVLLCSPPRADGCVDPTVLYAAALCGIDTVFRIGGVQAIAAMAWGSDSVPACDKLFGPGNAWVTEAKRQVAATSGGPAIDLPAGPSEVLVIADADADPRFVAADLLSQAEHGPDSQVILASDSGELIEAVQVELAVQLPRLARADIARRALASSRLIRVESLAQAAELSNAYAPEHLILQVRRPRALLDAIECAGAVFLGPWAPESVGDYCSGSNHVLPTGGHARAASGLSVDSFRTFMSVQELSRQGLEAIGPCAITLAEAEGLDAHARAVSLRLETPA